MNEHIVLENDPQIVIAVGENRLSKCWKNITCKLSVLYERCSKYQRTGEPLEEFLRLKETDTKKATAIKDHGGFVGGELDGTGIRSKETIKNRYVLTWDIDGAKFFELPPGIGYCRYTTHAHHAEDPRYRYIVPLSRPVSPTEYEQLSRLYVWEVVDHSGIDPNDVFSDDSTHQPERLMFWPTVSSDGEFQFDYQDGLSLDVDRILDTDKKGFYPSKDEPEQAERPPGDAGQQHIENKTVMVPHGERWKAIMAHAGTLANQLYKDNSEKAILLMLWQWANEHCEPPIPELDDFKKEYRRAVHNYKTAAEQDSRSYSLIVGAFCQARPDEELPRKPNGRIDWDTVRAVAESTGLPLSEDGAHSAVYDSSSKSFKPAKELPTELVPLSDIAPVKTEWLVPGWIPKATLTILGADGGTGKTAVVCNIIAALVTGRASILEQMEGENPYEERQKLKVMFFSSEDSFSHVLVGRLLKCGADLTRVFTIPAADERFREIRYDSAFLEKLVADNRPDLLVFDPLQGFIDGAIHMGERNAMRQCLSPLLALGDVYGVTTLIVMHTNKQSGVSGRSRFADSSDIYDLARSAIEMGICPNEIGSSGQKLRYISHAKNNYGQEHQTILFDIPDGVATFSGVTDKKARDFILEANKGPREERPTTPRDGAKESIMELLVDGQKPVKEVDEYLDAIGYARRTIQRAKEDLKSEKKIIVYNTGYGSEKQFFIKPI